MTNLVFFSIFFPHPSRAFSESTLAQLVLSAKLIAIVVWIMVVVVVVLIPFFVEGLGLGLVFLFCFFCLLDRC